MPLDYRDRNQNFRQRSRWVIHHRAENRCEHCGVPNCSVGHWEKSVSVVEGAAVHRCDWVPVGGNAIADFYGQGHSTYGKAQEYAKFWTMFTSQRVLTIKLQCAHLDHSETNDHPDNLRALCQRCHRHHDSVDNAARRMYGEKGQHREQITIFNDIPYATKPEGERPAKPKHPPKRRYTRRTASGTRQTKDGVS